ncbi:hypothetical protein [Pedobacter sp. UBA4863]|uniref:hypothetical protein n=1 Tax=Pedobacter sp. UBA4863 TaxID=1947060 RepID=UPI0025EA39A1|nr:hypothetical protein [Pedobacter sp. UBA4863]
MALFSSTAATAKLTKVKPRHIEKPLGGREFKNYTAYKNYLLSIGKTPRPKDDWFGKDGYWQRSERVNAWRGWRNAVYYITSRQNPVTGELPWLMPFGQILAYYKQMYVFVKQKKHESKWLYGAYYLVEDLWEAYEDDLTPAECPIFTNPILLQLLKDLNTGIAEFAITQFYRLLFGEFKNSPRIGQTAFDFDRNFIIREQCFVAYDLYNDVYNIGASGLSALLDMSSLFNNELSWVGFIKSVDPTGIVIPVIGGCYNSNLANPTERYGQDARTQVPLAMLYPNSYFADSTLQLSDILPIDAEYPPPVFTPQFRRYLRDALASHQFIYHFKFDSNGKIIWTNREAAILRIYTMVNKRVMKVFN